jgi:hypothetical protein
MSSTRHYQRSVTASFADEGRAPSLEQLSPRAAELVALTEALTRVYRQELGDLGMETSVVARCVSYTVWAYLTTSVMPEELAKELRQAGGAPL